MPAATKQSASSAAAAATAIPQIGQPDPAFVVPTFPLQISDVRTAVLLLHSPETDVLPHVIAWLAKFAEQSPKNQAQLRQMNVIQELEKQLSQSVHPALRKLCTGCIAKIMPKVTATPAETVVAVVAATEPQTADTDRETAELVEHLAQLTLPAGATVDTQDDTSTILLSLSYQVEKYRVVAAAGGVKILASLLKAATDNGVRTNVTSALKRMLRESYIRDEFVQLDGMAGLLAVASGGVPGTETCMELLDNVFTCLTIMAASDASQSDKICAQLPCNKFAAVCTAKDASVQASGYSLLSQLLSAGPNKVEGPCGPLATALMTQSDAADIKVKLRALKCLRMLCSNGIFIVRHQQELKGAGLEKLILKQMGAIVAAAEYPTAGTEQELACRCMLEIVEAMMNSVETATCTSILDSTGKLFQKFRPVRAEWIVMAAAIAQSGEPRALQLQTNGTAAAINAALKSPDSAVQTAAFLFHLRLCQFAAFKVACVADVSLVSTILSINGATDSYGNAVPLFLCRLLNTVEGRNKFAQVVDPAVLADKLLSHTPATELRAWLLAIKCACTDSNVVAKLSCSAFLSALSELSVRHESIYARLVDSISDALLSTDLSLKYRTRRKLASFETIPCGFRAYFDEPSQRRRKQQQQQENSADEETTDRFTIFGHSHDRDLLKLLNKCRDLVDGDDRRQMVAEIARLVVEHANCTSMPVSKYFDRLQPTPNKSGIPAGKVRLGNSAYRALLFKYLCDCPSSDSVSASPVLSGVSLDKNEYGLAWNTVVLAPPAGQIRAQTMLVDLSGRRSGTVLTPVESKQAADYLTGNLR